MGAAIPIMHYTGMAAVTFTPMDRRWKWTRDRSLRPRYRGHHRDPIDDSRPDDLTSLVDRRFSAQAVVNDVLAAAVSQAGEGVIIADSQESFSMLILRSPG